MTSPIPDRPLVGRVGVRFRVRNGFRQAFLRWKSAVGGRFKVHLEFFRKVTKSCGTRRWNSLMNDCRAAANIKTAELRGERVSSRPPPDKTVQERITHFLAVHEDIQAEATAEWYRRTLDGFAAYLRDEWPRQFPGEPLPLTVREIMPNHVQGYEGWRKAHGAAEGTIINDLQRIGRFLSWAAAMRWRDVPINTKDPALIRPTPRPDPVSNEQVFAALRWGDDGQRLAMTLLAATGMRDGELARMKRSAWNAATRALHVPPSTEHTKRSERDTGLGPFAAGLLDAWLTAHPDTLDSPMIRGATADRMRYWTRKAGLRCPKQFRQWFCSTLEQWPDPECPDRIINKLMGHVGGRDVGEARRHYSFGVNGRPWIERIDSLLATGVAQSAHLILPSPPVMASNVALAAMGRQDGGLPQTYEDGAVIAAPSLTP